MNLERRVRSRNPPKRSYNDCRRLDVMHVCHFPTVMTANRLSSCRFIAMGSQLQGQQYLRTQVDSHPGTARYVVLTTSNRSCVIKLIFDISVKCHYVGKVDYFCAFDCQRRHPSGITSTRLSQHSLLLSGNARKCD